MTLSGAPSKFAKVATAFLVVVAILEFGVAAYTAYLGGFSFALGGLRVRSSDPWKPCLIGMLSATVAVWVADRRSGLSNGFEIPIRTGRLLLFCGTIAALLPLLAPIVAEPGFAFGHDVGGHATYAFLFDRALGQGQFPVRWVESIQHGNGQPLFNFYQVGFYYLVQVVHLLVPSLSSALKYTVALSWAAGALFMYLLSSRHGRTSGAMAAIVFVWSRYLMLDGYVRAAYPELTAIGLAPGVLWTVERFLTTGRPGFLSLFILLSAVLTICHPPTALITGPVGAAYVLYLWGSGRSSGPRVCRIVPAAILAAAMTAFFTWPALAELDDIQLRTLGQIDAGLDYRNHFLAPREWVWSTWGYGASQPPADDEMSFGAWLRAGATGDPNDEMSLRLSRMQWVSIASAIALLGTAIATGRNLTRARDLAWWLGVAAFGLFMTTRASAQVWESVPPLWFVLFPWRYMMLVAIACGVMAGIGLSAVRGRYSRATVLVCVVVLQVYFTRDARALTEDYPVRFAGRNTGRIVIDIDNPRWPETANARDWAYTQRIYDPAAAAQAPPVAPGRWRITAGAGTVRADVVKDHELSLEVSTSGMRMTIYSRYMPGWSAWLDGKPTRVAVQPDSGYMMLDVPPGEHRLDVRFTDTRVRRWANLLSAASAIVWLGWSGSIMFRRRDQRRSRGDLGAD
jgi:hypothetical protein